jgi:hypothetical protein
MKAIFLGIALLAIGGTAPPVVRSESARPAKPSGADDQVP